jgi:Amt family ammonium transporter
MIVYLGLGKTANVTTAGLFYGNPKQLWIQGGAALTVIVWDGVVTYLILRVIKFFTPLRMPDAELLTGDLAVHGEEAYPVESADEVPALVGAADGPDDPFLDQEKALTE